MFREFIAAHLGLLYELSGVILILVAVIAVSGALISRFDRIPLEDARILIAQAVAVEVWDTLRNKKSFNRERFVRNLKKLPQEPKE